MLAIDVECSGGTYVRTLAADLGRLLGGGAHLRHLRRTAVGPFTIDEAAPPDECALLRPPEAVRGDGARRRRRGNRRPDRRRAGAATPRPEPARGRCVDADGDVLAVYEAFGDGQAKPAVVLPPGPSAAPSSV